MNYTTLPHKVGNPDLVPTISPESTGFDWDFHESPLWAISRSGISAQLDGKKAIFGPDDKIVATVGGGSPYMSPRQLIEFIETHRGEVVDVGLVDKILHVGFVYEPISEVTIAGHDFLRVFYIIDRLDGSRRWSSATVLWYKDTWTPIRLKSDEKWCCVVGGSPTIVLDKLRATLPIDRHTEIRWGLNAVGLLPHDAVRQLVTLARTFCMCFQKKQTETTQTEARAKRSVAELDRDTATVFDVWVRCLKECGSGIALAKQIDGKFTKNAYKSLAWN